MVDCWISRQERPHSDGPFVVKHRRNRSCKLEDLSRRVEAARERLLELTLPARNIGSALEKIVVDLCIGLPRRHHRMERYAAPLLP